MQDDTRDALLLAIAEWIKSTQSKDPWAEIVDYWLRQAKHEQDRPNDRGA